MRDLMPVEISDTVEGIWRVIMTRIDSPPRGDFSVLYDPASMGDFVHRHVVWPLTL